MRVIDIKDTFNFQYNKVFRIVGLDLLIFVTDEQKYYDDLENIYDKNKSDFIDIFDFYRTYNYQNDSGGFEVFIELTKQTINIFKKLIKIQQNSKSRNNIIEFVSDNFRYVYIYDFTNKKLKFRSLTDYVDDEERCEIFSDDYSDNLTISPELFSKLNILTLPKIKIELEKFILKN
jgi:hypothetical protein